MFYCQCRNCLSFSAFKVVPSASSYPRYLRTLMGVAAPYAIFMFPPHISLDVYIQVLPNLVEYICDIKCATYASHPVSLLFNTNRVVTSSPFIRRSWKTRTQTIFLLLLELMGGRNSRLYSISSISPLTGVAVLNPSWP